MGLLVDEFNVLVYIEPDGGGLIEFPRTMTLKIRISNRRVVSSPNVNPVTLRGVIGLVNNSGENDGGGILCIFYSLTSTPCMIRVGVIEKYRKRGLQWFTALANACVEPIDDINDVLTVMEFV